MRGHRPPIPNPQPDPGPLPDPAPIPSPEPTPIPEPLPPPFVAHEMREEIAPDRADVEPGEIGQETRFNCAMRRNGVGERTPARFSMKSMAHQCVHTGGVRLVLVLVIAWTMFVACQPRKPAPLVFHERYSPTLAFSLTPMNISVHWNSRFRRQASARLMERSSRHTIHGSPSAAWNSRR